MFALRTAFFLTIFAYAFTANIRHEIPQTLGLYDPSDDVEELTLNNFDRYIYGSEKSWLVEFYSSLCGHCRNYAPTYKKVATFFKYIKDGFVVAAVDCSNDLNQPLCRDFEIMGYPTLRYFHENFVQGPQNLGVNIQKPRANELVDNVKVIVDALVKEQEENRALRIPSLAPYEYSDTSRLFSEYTFLVLENETSTYGLEATMYFHKVPKISFKYSPKSNTDLAEYLEVSELPTLVILNNRSIERKIFKLNEINKHVIEYLRGININIDDYIPNAKKIITTTPTEEPEHSESQNLIDRIKLMGDTVFLADLEAALRYSLRKEIARHKIIDGEKLQALKSYLQIISKYFPLNERNRKLISNATLLASKNEIHGIEIFQLMKNSDNIPNLWQTNNEWLRCVGSTKINRGYTCGVWTMFHYLTVSAAEMQNGSPGEVLKAMHGYIKNFFGCTDCSQHFQQMAINRKLDSVSTFGESILWLWRAHNEVNKRISGDATEDPQFPKRQFPISERCPECSYRNGTWNEMEVEKYLRHIYSRDNLRSMSSGDLLAMSLESFKTRSSNDAVLGSLDLSMFIILYFVSFLLLIALVRIFLLKRGYRKKPYVHDLLGKV